MPGYVVRIVKDRQAVGLFYAKSVDLLRETVDEITDYQDCEYATIRAFGVEFPGKAVSLPHNPDGDDYTIDGYYLDPDAIDALRCDHKWTPLSDESSSFVYFVKCLDRVKIGKADDVPKRIRELQTAAPAKLELIGTVHGGLEFEKVLHLRLAKHRLSGEWFTFNEEVRAVIEEVIG